MFWPIADQSLEDGLEHVLFVDKLLMENVIDQLTVLIVENHSASSKKCERYLIEREIQAVRTKQHISFSEARETVMAQYIRPGVSYSSVLTKCKQRVSETRKKTDTEKPRQDSSLSEDNRKGNHT